MMRLVILILLMLMSLRWLVVCSTPKERASELVGTMSLESQLKLVRGVEGVYVGNVEGQEEYRIPEVNLEDGPQGVADKVRKVTCWPSALSIVSSWDVDLMERYSGVLADEQRKKGTNVMLGPMTNLARVPFGGRNFESFGEDPHLASEMMRGSVTGIQKKGVIGCAKHFVNNNQEQDRGTVSAKVSDRTNHELYFPPFQAAVEANVGSFMCSYNKINGTYACENDATLNKELKERWGFEGFVMSDWGGTHSTVDAANNGLDMEMPRDQYFGDALKSAVNEGKVTKERIADMAIRILTPMFAVGIMDTPQTGNITDDVTSPEHTKLAQEFAERIAVLVKNDGILPLDPKKEAKIAVIGDVAQFDPIVTGDGSGHVCCETISTPFHGIKDKLVNVSVVAYARSHPYDEAVKLAEDSDVAIIFVGTRSGEGSDRKSLSLGLEQDTLIENVAQVQPNTIVVVHTPAAATMPWIHKVPATIVQWFGGQETGAAIANVIFGDVNPSGKLPITFPINDKQNPLKNPIQYPGIDQKTEYTEELLMGYRWYDQEDETPLFPFGHGLSYTTFKFGDISLSSTQLKEGETLKVSVDITNTGDVEGREVAQMYLAYPLDAGEPPQLLKGFQGIILQPGKSGTVEFEIEWGKNVGIWDVITQDWKVIAGEFTVQVGSSSRDLRQKKSFEVVV